MGHVHGPSAASLVVVEGSSLTGPLLIAAADLGWFLCGNSHGEPITITVRDATAADLGLRLSGCLDCARTTPAP